MEFIDSLRCEEMSYEDKQLKMHDRFYDEFAEELEEWTWFIGDREDLEAEED